MGKAVFLGVAMAGMIVAGSPASADQTMMRGAPMEASDPLRLRAEGLANLVFQGKLAEARTMLGANAVPGSPAASDTAGQIDALAAQFAGGGYQLDRAVKMGEDQIVVYGRKADGGRVALVFAVETASPYRVREVIQATMGNGRR